MVLLRKYYSTFTGVLDLLSKKQKTNGKETDYTYVRIHSQGIYTGVSKEKSRCRSFCQLHRNRASNIHP